MNDYLFVFMLFIFNVIVLFRKYGKEAQADYKRDKRPKVRDVKNTEVNSVSFTEELDDKPEHAVDEHKQGIGSSVQLILRDFRDKHVNKNEVINEFKLSCRNAPAVWKLDAYAAVGDEAINPCGEQRNYCRECKDVKHVFLFSFEDERACQIEERQREHRAEKAHIALYHFIDWFEKREKLDRGYTRNGVKNRKYQCRVPFKFKLFLEIQYPQKRSQCCKSE